MSNLGEEIGGMPRPGISSDGQVEPVSLGSSPSRDASNHDMPEGHDTLLKIRAIEKQILEGKLVLVGDDGQPLKPTGTVDATTSTGANPFEHLKVPQSQKELEEMLSAIGYSKPPQDTSGPMASNVNAHGAIGIEKDGVHALKQPA